MKKILFLLAIISIIIGALPVQADEITKTGMYYELGGRRNPSAVGGELGIVGYISDNLAARGGIAFLASDSFNDVFGGVTAGLRYSLKGQVTPFIGAGAFVGYVEQETINAAGESVTELSDALISIYPEAGLNIWLSDDFLISGSYRYNLTTKGNQYDFGELMFGMSVFF